MADGNVVPFLAEGRCGNGLGEDAMVPIRMKGVRDSVEYDRQCQATRAGQGVGNL